MNVWGSEDNGDVTDELRFFQLLKAPSTSSLKNLNTPEPYHVCGFKVSFFFFFKFLSPSSRWSFSQMFLLDKWWFWVRWQTPVRITVVKCIISIYTDRFLFFSSSCGFMFDSSSSEVSGDPSEAFGLLLMIWVTPADFTFSVGGSWQ